MIGDDEIDNMRLYRALGIKYEHPAMGINKLMEGPRPMTNQEKMKKIYESTRVEPGMWCTGDTIYQMQDKTFEQCIADYTAYDMPAPSPHYPESQLWEMLPAVIDDFVLIAGKDLNLITLGYYWQRGNRISSDDSLTYLTAVDLHTALIDMVLWCIEEGYIKGKNDEH